MKIGIFGGSFDPVHNGHVNLAVTAKNACGLDKIIIIPTYSPPHKSGSAAEFNARLDMCVAAFGQNGFEVSDIERDIGGKSYTIYTLERLTGLYPQDSFYLILGGDELLTFDKWYGYRDILSKCTVVAAARSKDQYDKLTVKAESLGNVIVININVKEISSSDIRTKLKNYENVSDLLPEQVVRYININNLYTE